MRFNCVNPSRAVLTLFATITLLVASVPAEAASVSKGGGPLGAGVVFGEPTGLTAKYWMSTYNALDVGAAWSFGSYLLVYGDYLWHFDNPIRELKAPITPYMGLGGVLFVGGSPGSKYFKNLDSVGLGMRVPLGLEWVPDHPPIGVFLELVPGVGIVPAVFGFLQGGLGIRYYF